MRNMCAARYARKASKTSGGLLKRTLKGNVCCGEPFHLMHYLKSKFLSFHNSGKKMNDTLRFEKAIGRGRAIAEYQTPFRMAVLLLNQIGGTGKKRPQAVHAVRVLR